MLLSIFDSAGSFDGQEYEYKDLVTGWGIPTATDIAICWAVAVVVFGAGHPAVKYGNLDIVLGQPTRVFSALFHPHNRRVVCSTLVPMLVGC